jgi:hypothetical protein
MLSFSVIFNIKITTPRKVMLEIQQEIFFWGKVKSLHQQTKQLKERHQLRK